MRCEKAVFPCLKRQSCCGISLADRVEKLLKGFFTRLLSLRFPQPLKVLDSLGLIAFAQLVTDVALLMNQATPVAARQAKDFSLPIGLWGSHLESRGVVSRHVLPLLALEAGQ